MLRDAAQVAVGMAAVALMGTMYVIIHERRRKLKKERSRSDAGQSSSVGSPGGGGAGPSLSKERLIELLAQSAQAAYQLIEQTRKLVYAKHEQTGIPLEKCVEELQTNFEAAMEARPQPPFSGPSLGLIPRRPPSPSLPHLGGRGSKAAATAARSAQCPPRARASAAPWPCRTSPTPRLAPRLSAAPPPAHADGRGRDPE